VGSIRNIFAAFNDLGHLLSKVFFGGKERAYCQNYTVLHILSIMFQLVVAVGLSLNIANLIGYVRCKKDTGKKIKTFAGNFLGRQLLNQVFFSSYLKNTE